jgi:protocatechuate 3,4-dioxygenase beta subunit
MPATCGRATRGGFLKTVFIAVGFGLAGMLAAEAQQLDPMPACRLGDVPTPRQTEGPFFKAGAPERIELIEAGIPGQVIEIAGFVLTRSCKPVAGARIDVWQADGAGHYDNNGYRLRGHQLTDGEGRYRLRSVVPGSYEGRTRHVHVKVQPPGGRALTTQLYFPGEAANRRDALFRSELTVRTAKANGELRGRFDFVLDMR